MTFNLCAIAQNFEPGVTYKDSTGFIEFMAGNVPVIISTPHGGYLEPDSIPDCPNCSSLRDAFTQEIARDLSTVYFEHTGCYLHVVINLLHRIKLDANRTKEDATGGEAILENAWIAYHAFIDSAKATIIEDFDRGLFLDIHGHAHANERIELGYLLSKAELQKTEQELNTPEIVMESSIQALVNSNLQSLTHAELLRGPNSFGTLMDQKGFPSVPSSSDIYPLDTESYFTGGFNTRRHGSFSGGTIDAIQLEFNQSIRLDSTTRAILVDSLVNSIIEYIDLHYYDDFLEFQCNGTTNITELESDRSIQLYPNPSNEVINFAGLQQLAEVLIFDLFGKQVGKYLWDGNALNVEDLNFGNYIIVVKNKQVCKTFKFLKLP